MKQKKLSMHRTEYHTNKKYENFFSHSVFLEENKMYKMYNEGNCYIIYPIKIALFWALHSFIL